MPNTLNIDYAHCKIAIEALNATKNMAEAAAMIGINKHTLSKWKKRYSIKRDDSTKRYYLSSKFYNMNKRRRAAINKLKDQLTDMQTSVEEIRDQEQQYFDGMPESFRDAEKGQKAESVISVLEEALSSVESAIESLTEAQE